MKKFRILDKLTQKWPQALRRFLTTKENQSKEFFAADINKLKTKKARNLRGRPEYTKQPEKNARTERITQHVADRRPEHMTQTVATDKT